MSGKIVFTIALICAGVTILFSSVMAVREVSKRNEDFLEQDRINVEQKKFAQELCQHDFVFGYSYNSNLELFHVECVSEEGKKTEFFKHVERW